MAAPSILFQWDTNAVNSVQPSAGLTLNGWATNAIPASSNHNWMFNLIGQWISFLQNGPSDQALAEQVSNWQYATVAAGAVIYGAAFDGTHYVLVGYNGTHGISYRSLDLINWTAGTPTSAGAFLEVIWDGTNNKFIATNGATAPYYSSDGLTWTLGSGGTGYQGGVATNAGTTIGVGGGSGNLWRTTDAVNYHGAGGGPTALPNGVGNAIAVGNPGSLTWVVGVTDTTNQIAYSTNAGTAWTAAAFPGSPGTSCVGVCWNGSEFLALDSAGNVYKSPTGAVWTLVHATVTANVQGGGGVGSQSPLIGDANQLIIIENSIAAGQIWQSFDAGVTWTKRFGSRLDKANFTLFFDQTNGVFLDCRTDTLIGKSLILPGS